MLNNPSQSEIYPTRLTEVLTAVPTPTNRSLGNNMYLKRAPPAVDLETDKLTPEIRDLILNNFDPLIPLVKDGLIVAEELPLMMGATSEGPKTYLILVENEDEFRPTGGLVTAVGTLLMQNGRISSLYFELMIVKSTG